MQFPAKKILTLNKSLLESPSVLSSCQSPQGRMVRTAGHPSPSPAPQPSRRELQGAGERKLPGSWSESSYNCSS